MRNGPRHPWLGAAGFHLARTLLVPFFRRRNIFRADSEFARARFGAIRSKIERGETSYLAGVSSVGFHNSGIALIELTRARGPRLIFNNEEERFSGEKHTNAYPRHSIEHMLTAMAAMGLNAGHIDAWLTSWDYAAVWATLIRVTLEEAPAGFSMLRDQRRRRSASARLIAAPAPRVISPNSWD